MEMLTQNQQLNIGQRLDSTNRRLRLDAKYQSDQARRWWWAPSWFPGNSNTPTFSVDYRMKIAVNGQTFTWG